MSDETDLERLLENFQAALNTLNGIEDVEGLLSKLDAKNDRKLLKKVKTIVGDVHNKVNGIREKVSKTYKRVKTRGISEGEDKEVSDKEGENLDLEDSVVKNKHSNSTDNSETSEGGDNVDNNESVEIVESTPERVPRLKLSFNRNKSGKEKDDSVKENVDKTSDNVDSVESNTVALDGEGEKEDKEMASNDKDKDEDSNEASKDTEISSDSENLEEIKKKGPPVIKLVDINKLLAPKVKPMELTPTPTKSRKSVTFDNSVIVLTSSDEDTPKRNPKGPEQKTLKSVLRKSPSKTIDLSDSDSKENNENLRNTKKAHKKRQKLHSDLSSDDSDHDVSFKPRRLRKQDQTAKKNSFSRLLRERKVKQDRKKYDEHSPDKKSKRNHDGETSDSEDDDRKANPRKRKKKELLEDSSLSDNSDSDTYKSKSRSKKKQPQVENINDHKLKAKVYIRLPKYETEQLVKLYKGKKEILDIKSLSSKANLSRPQKNPDKSIKLTLRLNNKAKQNKVSSEEEEDEHSSKDDSKLPTDEEEVAKIVDLPPENGAPEDETQPDLANVEQISDQANEEEANNKNSEEDEAEPIKELGPTASDKAEQEIDKPKCNGNLSNEEEETDKNHHSEEEKEEESNAINEQEKCQESDSSDSDDFSKVSKKKDKPKKKTVREPKKKKKKIISDSESGEEEEEVNKDSDDSEDARGNESNDSLSDKEEDKEEENKPTRKRIKRVKDSSSDDEDKSTRKQIRKMIDKDSLSETTKRAEQDEKARKARILEKQKKYNQIFDAKADATVDKVVLDFDEKTDKPLLSVHKKLVKQLKPHQVQGVKFMWDACFESLDRMVKAPGSGCILAHCMGLGKTLQVIALSHTLLTNQEKTKVKKILVVCPVNTVLNWRNEYKKWMPNEDDVEVYELVSCKTSSVNHERSHIVNCWHEGGGVLIIGYSMFRTLSNPDNKTISKKLKQSFKQGLVDPGPDMVVCDEGHLLKNEKTNLSIAMNRIKTARRIVLTGTPLQNNLREYWCMVQFIKPNLLGTYKEYLNRFVNPITNGQYTDSTQHDIMVMRRRSHVLHKLLDGVVQRQDYAVLEPYLPPKYEFVLFLRLTDTQIKLYKHYINNFARKGDGSNRTSFLFTDFQELQRICTHPRVLLDKSIENKEKKEKEDDTESEGSIKDFLDDGSDEASSTSSSDEGSDSGRSKGSGSDASVRSKEKKKKTVTKRTRLTRAQAAQKREDGLPSESDDDIQEASPKEWWEEYISRNALDNINDSSKMFLLFQILKECEEIGDKILVFSQSLYTLNCIEYFLAKIDEATQNGETDHAGSWSLGLDYFRLDGSSSCDNRASWCDHFNDPENTRARLFLISTKAGGLGINLVAANRVIIFDVSWNPSHDIQSIYRVYRFGQTKPSYIYRFVTYGAMEMKIYERQVTKQAISKRVIDEQQIDRHYSQNDIQELYKTDLEPTDRPIPMVPKDVLLGEMLQKHEQTIYKYHEHQSLLENKQDEELNEDERKTAWEEFENEKVIRKTSVANFGGVNLGAIHGDAFHFSPHLIQIALASIVRKDNPAWSEVQIKGILPALVTQLQVQMSENDFSMYNRVQQEIRLMQALQAQHLRENFIKQYQQQQLMQKQQLANQMLGSMSITPEEIRRLQMAQAGRSSDVIELND